jgi:predicted ATPase/DNA-binding SARP family transcriptional activator
MLTLSLLGPFQAQLSQKPLLKFSTNKVQALLIYLAVEARQIHQREVLMTLLWPGLPLKSAQQNLRQTLYLLRKTLQVEEGETPFIMAERFTLGWNPESPLTLDVTQFEKLSDASQVAVDWQQAADLYRGDFLADFYLPDSEPFEAWATNRRSVYQRIAQEVLLRLSTHYLAEESFELAETAVRRQLELEKLSEIAHCQLMKILALTGRRQEALALYDDLCQRLFDEMAIEPTQETTALVKSIRSGDFIHTATHTQTAPSIIAERSHPVSHEQKLFTPTHNFPPQPTPFIGRMDELAALNTYLTDPGIRLVTIVGPGGIGKTQLVIACARQIATVEPPQFPDGIFFISLAAISDPDRIIPTMAEGIDFQLQGGEQERRTPQQQILDFLREKQKLLIMEDFEHLLDSMGFLADILDTAPGVQIIATSRERLHLQQEQVYPIQGLEFPDWETREDALEYAAVQLFLQSAHRNQPDFALTGEDDLTNLARISRLVAGMPLAIELAAAWVDMLSLAEIAAEMEQGLDILETAKRDMPERQRSIRATIDYSWQKLDVDQQAVFAQLSVFQGGFTRYAADVVSGASLRQLSRLVHKSLLQFNQPQQRYQMHELLRQYGVEKLAEDKTNQKAVHRKHAQYYTQFLGEKETQLYGRQEAVAMREIIFSIDNIQAAWQWLVQEKQGEKLLASMNALRYYYATRGCFQVGLDAFDSILRSFASPRSPTEHWILGRAHNWYAWLLMDSGEHGPKAIPHLEKAAQVFTEIEATGQNITIDKGFTKLLRTFAVYQEDLKQAVQDAESALRLFSAANFLWGISFTLSWLAWIPYIAGLKNYEETRKAGLEAKQMAEESGNVRLEFMAVSAMVFAAYYAGDVAAITRLLEEKEALIFDKEDPARLMSGLRLKQFQLTLQGRFIECLENRRKQTKINQILGRPQQAGFPLEIAHMYLHLGRYQEAEQQITSGLDLAKQLKNLRTIGFGLILKGMAQLIANQLDEAEQTLEEGLRYVYDNQSNQAGMLANLGLVLARKGDTSRAKCCLFSSLKIAVTTHSFLALIEVLPGIALVLAHDTPPDPERAVELHGLLLAQPIFANSQLYTDMSGKALSAIAQSLPSAFAQSALRRGGAMEIWVAAASLMDELTQQGWDEER